MEGLERLFYSCTHLHDLNIIFDIKKIIANIWVESP